MSPYKALFGSDSYLGIEASQLPNNELKKVNTARQLYALLGIYLLINKLVNH